MRVIVATACEQSKPLQNINEVAIKLAGISQRVLEAAGWTWYGELEPHQGWLPCWRSGEGDSRTTAVFAQIKGVPNGKLKAVAMPV
jgi:hypothetical protein